MVPSNVKMEDHPLEYTILGDDKVEAVLEDEKKEEEPRRRHSRTVEEPVDDESPPPSPQSPEQHPEQHPEQQSDCTTKIQTDETTEAAVTAEPDGTFAENFALRSEPLVKFGNVMVREYDRVIDSTQIYMGLALGWDFNESEPAPLLDSIGPEGGVTKRAAEGNRGGEESRMKRTNGSERYGMLLRYGYAQKELKKATNEAAKFYKQRQKEVQRDAARSLVVADERKKHQGEKNQRKPLFGSMFRR